MTQLSDITGRARGSYVQLEQLIAQRFPARKLQLLHRNRALSALAGANKSNFRGRGIDFEEVRRYQAGDDIRSIDWRVTARTGAAHTKLFREERERPVMLLVDQRQGMFFGSRYCFKSVLAAHLAALLTWSALEGGDKIGGLVFNRREHREIKPRRSRRTALALLSEICKYNAALPAPPGEGGATLSDTLANLRRVTRPGSNVFLISDFQGIEDDMACDHLFQLAQHTQISAITCADSLEMNLPRGGRYAVTDGELRSELNTAHQGLREAYRESYRQRQEALDTIMQRLGIPLLRATTDESPFNLLQTYFGEARP
ncbi:hypothetical protein GCM10007052_12700 [Halioglobus japonicus]|uniref:DUF58 domain-containing protein n=1 Tax=Halioglobus japonicus TaxID=930805 RepID=A0AAP8MEW4_9GAMM|nr:DUF58 domain-containing protein [Halioglobus japonicus]PLW86575.1 DUF58 domain-containing protein [Halioglobus japonicus]GHD12168.1 hypothetical protein GCM10007052_12700 [Halioglobus japonicus]